MESKELAGYTLTEREIEILQMIGEGRSSQQIAEQSKLTLNTVATHRKNMLRKANTRNIISVLICAIQRGIVTIDSVAA